MCPETSHPVCEKAASDIKKPVHDRIFMMMVVIIALLLPVVQGSVYAETIINGNIITDTTWSAAGNPYIVTTSVSVQGNDGSDGITELVVDPGVEVRFNSGARLTIGSNEESGKIRALGTESNKIVFTSNQATLVPGDWGGIIVYGNSGSPESLFDYCDISYAGASDNPAISFINGSATVKNSIIHHNKKYGLKGSNGTQSVQNNQFSDNGYYDIYLVSSSQSQIIGNTINNGIYTYSNELSAISQNIIHYNNSYPVRINAALIKSFLENNTITGTTIDSFIEVNGGTIIDDTILQNRFSYHILSSVTINGPAADAHIVVLSAEPGTTLKFNANSQLSVGDSKNCKGRLDIQGTSDLPVVFTSMKPVPAPGDWRGIKIYGNGSENENSLIDNAVIEYAGYGQGALYIYKDNTRVRDSAIHQNLSYGVYVGSGIPEITENKIENNGDYGIKSDYYSGGVILNNFIGNGIMLGGYQNTLTLQGNTIELKTEFPLSVPADNVKDLFNGNTLDDKNPDIKHTLIVSGGNVIRNTVWADFFTYLITDNISIINPGDLSIPVTLTLLPGCELRFATGKELKIGYWGGNYTGALVAQGTPDKHIIFTSAQSVPAPGDWRGITMIAASPDESSTILEYCDILYAGNNHAGFYNYQGSPTIRNSSIRFSANYGFYSSYGVPVIENNIFSDNAGYDFYFYCYSNGTVIGNNIANGIYINGVGVVDISGNTIMDNENFPLRLNANSVCLLSENNYSGSPGSVVEVTYGIIDKDSLLSSRFVYHIIGDIYVSGTDGADGITTLTIEPGTELKFDKGRHLTVGYSGKGPGILDAQGTADNHIRFTSLQDQPAPGDWKGIRLYDSDSTSASVVRFCDVDYAGSELAALYISGDAAIVENSIIKHSLQHGIYIYDSPASVKFNIFQDNTEAGAFLYGQKSSEADIDCNSFIENRYGLYLKWYVVPRIENNSFLGNSEYQVLTEGNSMAEASGNWWGADSDPSASVSGSVNVTPWLTEANGCLSIEVPDLQDLIRADAENMIISAGFSSLTVTETYSNTIDVGRVVSQSPEAGEWVLNNTAISIVVSLGPEGVPVPDLTGKTRIEAESEISQGLLSVGTITEVYDNNIPQGQVISQSPLAGEIVASGTAVDLVISLGSNLISVPSITGMDNAAAQSTITAAGLVPGNMSYQYSSSVFEGTVISQSPLAGTQVPENTAVDLVIAIKPEVTVSGSETVTTSDSFFNIDAVISSDIKEIQSTYVTSDRFPGQQFNVTVDAHGHITGDIPLAVGDNILILTIRFTSGEEITRTITVKVELSAIPVIIITSPLNGSTSSNNTIDLKGEVRSSLLPEQIRLIHDDVVTFPTKESDGTYTFNFGESRLEEGYNTLIVTAETVYGTVTAQTVVYYTSTPEVPSENPPEIQVYSPLPGRTLTDRNLEVKGIVRGETDIVRVTVNDKDLTQASDAPDTQMTDLIIGEGHSVSFKAALIAPADATSFEIRIEAQDQTGLTKNLTYTVTFDSDAPVITITSPELQLAADIHTLTTVPLALTGTVTDTNLGGFSINGNSTGLLPGTGTTYQFSSEIYLDNGIESLITVEAWDMAGHRTSQEFKVMLNVTVDVDIISPKDGGELSVSGSTCDIPVYARAPGISDTDMLTARIDNLTPVLLTRAGITGSSNVTITAQSGSHTMTVAALSADNTVLAERTIHINLVNTDTLPVEVTQIIPEDNATGVEANQFISLNFNKEIDPSKLVVQVLETAHGKIYKEQDKGTDLTEQNNIELIEINREREVVPGGLSHFPEKTLAVFYPERDLAYNGQVFVTVLYDNEEISRTQFKTRPLPTLIEGFVTDELMQPLSGIHVEIMELGRTAMTDSEGAYTFGFGEDVSLNIPGGLYTIVANNGLKNRHYGQIRRKENIKDGLLNAIKHLRIPALNLKEPFRRIASGEPEVVLNQGNIVLYLDDTELLFPDNRNKGDVHVQLLEKTAIPFSAVELATPHWAYAFQPAGIEVSGNLKIMMFMPSYAGSYDYLDEIGNRVILVGLDPDVNKIVPMGVGHVDHGTRTITSEGETHFKCLDYIGYSRIPIEAQPLLDPVVSGEASMDDVISVMEGLK